MHMMNRNVLVTGGSGYIGSHVVLSLIENGFNPVIIDNLSNSARLPALEAVPTIVEDIENLDRVRESIGDHDISGIIHLAGSTVVPESIEKPDLYYRNNAVNSANLIALAAEMGVRNFVFSSTAAVYGAPADPVVTEETPLAPINPYGRSKLMTEWMLEDISKSSGLSYVALRYFNVAGADPKGRVGQDTPNATHLIKVACQAACGLRPNLKIFGTDFDTPDGTGVRDYIHVSDLADAHASALNHLAEGKESGVFNCGYGRGFSVRDVISTVERVSGRAVTVEETGRRSGDTGSLIADCTKLNRTMSWTPKQDDLETIVRTAFDWECRNS